MAYMCVLAPSKECDGCEECEEKKEEYDPRWDCEYDHDGEYADYCDYIAEREE